VEDQSRIEGEANDGDAGGASDDSKRVGEGVGSDTTRRPVAEPQRRRLRGHVGSDEASALFFDPLRRTERAHSARSVQPLSTQCAAARCRVRLIRDAFHGNSDRLAVSSRQQCCVIKLCARN